MSIGIFIDYENIYLSFKEQYGQVPKPDALAKLVNTKARELATQELSPDCYIALANAYADWELFEKGIQPILKENGVEPKYVLAKRYKSGKIGKNATDISMALDIYETLYDRGEVDLFVIVAGDRDYFDLVARLKRRGKMVFIFSVLKTTSMDIFNYIDEKHFVALEGFLFPQTEYPSLDFYKNVNWKDFVLRVHDALHSSAKGFLALSHLRNNLMRQWYAGSNEERQEILNEAIARGILKKDKIDNPDVNKPFTTVCKPNMQNPLVRKIFEENNKEKTLTNYGA